MCLCGFTSLDGLTFVVVWEELSELSQFVVSVHLGQQALQHQRNVLLIVDAMDHLDGDLEGRDRLLDITVRVGIVAIDLAELG